MQVNPFACEIVDIYAVESEEWQSHWVSSSEDMLLSLGLGIYADPHPPKRNAEQAVRRRNNNYSLESCRAKKCLLYQLSEWIVTYIEKL